MIVDVGIAIFLVFAGAALCIAATQWKGGRTS